MAAAVTYEFSPDLLAGGVGTQLDLSRFAKGNPQLAGVYRADIYLNGRWVLRRDVRLAGNPAVPCIDASLLGILGLDASSLSAEGQAALGTAAAHEHSPSCRSLESLTKDARAAFDAGELRLDIAVPQASLARQPKGYVPPASWDYGVNAALLGYNLNAFRSAGANGDSSSVFAGLNGGLNLGRWRLRHSGSYNRSSSGGSHYDELGTYVATDLPDWKSSLTIGDAYTTGQLFPSFRLRGAALAKDDRMLPDSQRGYAPVIRGVANSNAKVEIKQNNMVLYSTSVPPGPFEINDLYPTGYGGDLQVILTETDGTQKVTNVPFSSLPQLLREGTLDYSISAGQLLGYARRYEVLQGTLQYGLSNALTLDGGVLAARDYTAALIGAAWNSEAGAFQLNATQASFLRSAYPRNHGWSLDGSWAKVFPTTHTNLNFAAYRYSSNGYYSLDDAMRRLDGDAAGSTAAASVDFRTRNRALLSINQTLDNGLMFHASASSQDYWDHGGRQTAYQLGMNKQIGQMQWSLNATNTRSPVGGPAQNTYTVGMTLPLGGSDTLRNSVAASVTHDSVTGDAQQVGLFGSYGERGELNYGVSGQRSRLGNTLSANGSYHAKFATVGATLSTGRGIEQQSLTASGGLVGADGHVILAPFLGDTVGLVHVSGAQGLQIAASQASEIDADGFTLLPYLAPYSANPVELDVSKAPLSARFDSTSTVVAPHAGAVVLLNFKRMPGYTLMLSARRTDGSAVPFGASVYDSGGLLVGNVGQAGRVEAASESLTGSLRVSWGEEAGASCWIHYALPKPSSGDESLLQANVVCQPGTQPTMQADSGAAAGGRARKAYLLLVMDTQGQTLPKGAEVSLANDPDRVGVVGDGGRAVLSLRLDESATASMVARWSDQGGQSRQCVLVRQAAAVPSTQMPAHGQADAIEPACPVEMTRFNAGAAPETALAKPAAARSLAQGGI